MLTKQLVRRTVRDGRILPRWLKPKDQELAERMLEVFAAHVGATQGELSVAVKELEAGVTDLKLVRGLEKVCQDLLDTAAPTALDPGLVRRTTFELAATCGGVLGTDGRQRVLDTVAAQFGVTATEIEHALYSDLHAAQIVGPLPRLEPQDLVQRYNLGLAQALLLDARRLTIRLDKPTGKRLRQLLRWLKFQRLLHHAERDGTAWIFLIDGPLSVLDRPSRYGVSFASLLPALLLQERWTLEAECQNQRTTALLQLTCESGLSSPLRDSGVWSAPEEQALAARLTELAAPWTVTTDTDLVDLDGRGVLVPDLMLTDPATGRRALIEIVWRWRRAGFEARWEWLRKAGPPNLVLAVAASSDEQHALPELAGPVHAFKKLPNAKALLALCREVAV